MTGRVLHHRTGRLLLGPRTLVMGIVNATPDSFSDGGVNERPDDAAATGRRMVGDGADILDVGGESTRPGHDPVGADEEWRRVGPVLAGLCDAGVPISIDTSKAAVARQALAAGASIVNDVWGFRRDPDLAAATAEAGAAAILMHNRESVDPAIDIVDEILSVLDRSVRIALAAGVGEDRVVLDPGLGFGKTNAQSLAALAALPRIAELGFPILVGLSRKRFVGGFADRALEPAERWAGTLAGNVAAALAGADIVRVHDVEPHVQAVRMVQALKEAA